MRAGAFEALRNVLPHVGEFGRAAGTKARSRSAFPDGRAHPELMVVFPVVA